MSSHMLAHTHTHMRTHTCTHSRQSDDADSKFYPMINCEHKLCLQVYKISKIRWGLIQVQETLEPRYHQTTTEAWISYHTCQVLLWHNCYQNYQPSLYISIRTARVCQHVFTNTKDELWLADWNQNCSQASQYLISPSVCLSLCRYMNSN